MEDLFEPVVEVARRHGVWAELWGEVTEGLTVERRDGRVHAVEPYRETVFSVRIIHRGRAGLSYTTRAEAEAVRKAAERALELARLSEEEGAVPDPQPLPEVPEVRVAHREAGELAGLLEEAEEEALTADPRVHRIERSVLSWSETQYLIFQSEGVSARWSGGHYQFLISVTAREGEEERSAWEWREAPALENLNLRGLSREAAERAAGLLSARKIPSRRLPVIFPPQAAVSLLETLSHSFCGDEVARGRSRLAGRVGERVFAPHLTLVDDGLLPQGAETRPFDDEGAPQKETILVGEGVLEGFLYDTRWGRRAGVPSTGNARRASFRTLPSVSPTNLYLRPGEHSPDSLRRSAPAVLEICEMLGWHTTDPISGDFSVGISGFLHQNGERYPVAGLALSGNLFDLLRRVEAVGRDLTFYGDTGSPSLLIPDLDLSGS